mmetsp:Transcript_48520/g.113572  ORF Transcript_48520/g.113572 Transcript_48520/m.113572 type:complete len:177 (+) Transcript_48520:16-546(+)|eukprot:CAMPEP_0179928810 /NCGR_PEP_ID=MMETSP0983-20121128/9076_1 /TAXON_ID=483367 /ORGANISM="non described non described, Strain CCMP 2436" /LENGTH=176 /DNA_ID=CAMNT_0021832659 /DNA_START=15 /DNA_END=545 /DNA_ORIENTATION=+
MFKIIVAATLLALGAEAFAPGASRVGASRAVAPRDTSVMGTFVEDLKFKRYFNRFTFKTFSECIVKAGMEEDFAKNTYTIFVPTDAAFEELGAAALDAMSKEQLQAMIKYHMLEGTVEGPAFRLDHGKLLTTVQGGTLLVDADGKTAYVNDAKIETYDVKTDEGTFHIIDWVNQPK